MTGVCCAAPRLFHHYLQRRLRGGMEVKMNETERKLTALQESVSQLWNGLWANRKGYRTLVTGALTLTAFATSKPVALNIYTSAEHTAVNGWLHLKAKGSGSGSLVLEIISDHSGQTAGYTFPITTTYANYYIPFYLPLSKGWSKVEGAISSDTTVTVSAGTLQMVGTLVNNK